MTVQRTWSGERAVMVAVLVVGTARIATGNSTPDAPRAAIPSVSSFCWSARWPPNWPRGGGQGAYIATFTPCRSSFLGWR